MACALLFMLSFSTVLVLGSRFMAILNCFCHTTPAVVVAGKGASQHHHHVAVVVVAVADWLPAVTLAAWPLTLKAQQICKSLRSFSTISTILYFHLNSDLDLPFAITLREIKPIWRHTRNQTTIEHHKVLWRWFWPLTSYRVSSGSSS